MSTEGDDPSQDPDPGPQDTRSISSDPTGQALDQNDRSTSDVNDTHTHPVQYSTPANDYDIEKDPNEHIEQVSSRMTSDDRLGDLDETTTQARSKAKASFGRVSQWWKKQRSSDQATLPTVEPKDDDSKDVADEDTTDYTKVEPWSDTSSEVTHTPDDSEQKYASYKQEATKLVQNFFKDSTWAEHAAQTAQPPDLKERLADLDYEPAPDEYKPGIFGAILTSKLQQIQQQSTRYQQPYGSYDDHNTPGHKRSSSHDHSRASSGATTPTKKVRWYERPGERVTPTSAALMQALMSSTGPGAPKSGGAIPRSRISRPRSAGGMIASAVDLIKHGPHRKDEEDYQGVVAEVADIIACRTYLTKLCAAFMKYGAPTHRMEEYLAASARALLIDAEFLYMPGAMMCTFTDHTIHANNVEIVRQVGGLDFGRLKDVFDIYKNVIHGKFTAQEASYEIDQIKKRPNLYSNPFRILIFGLASVTVAPFGFSGRPIDFAPIFVLGCALGFMQLKVVPRSEHFSNVFEVFACVTTAFIARALGSIRWGHNGEYIFCFSAMAQSSIAMILPGFMVLNSALELQSRNIVSGSVRMVYSIIYVLFLGFGLLVGTTIFGLIKNNAVDDVTCKAPAWFNADDMDWKLIHTRFIWAPLFACCLAIVYQARWRQLPTMALIAVCGHQANFWISTRLSSNLQVANAIGAFVIGCMANLYSRLFHGLAAAAMLPAIYCQVPGGLAASGSLVAGIKSSNQIVGNDSSVSVINNGTQGFVSAQSDPNSVYGGAIFNVGYGMVQVAIGISVGLYLSALVVYPYGKRRSGLFSF